MIEASNSFMFTKPKSDLTRRHLAVSGLVMLGGTLLQGCTLSGFGNQAFSKNEVQKNTRPRSEISATPLNFDIGGGFDKLNTIRRQHLLPEFTIDSRLQKAAQDHANLMGSKGLYGHKIGPGTDFKSRIFAVGYNNSSGENLGVGYGSIDEALAGWLKSPDHKRNMMKPGYTLAGLAYGFNTSGKNPRFTHYWVLIMGKADRKYF